MRTQNILITGVSGQDGVFLANKILSDPNSKNVIFGISRQNPSLTIKKLKSIGAACENLNIINVNLLNLTELQDLIQKIKPDQIYNLAGPSSVYESINNPMYFETQINSIFDNLTNACINLNHFPKFFQACSSEMFSNKNNMPLNESSIFAPRSPYASAKYKVFNKVNNLKEKMGWNIKSGIMFNHESEFRDKNYLFMKIFHTAELIKKNKQDYLEIGSLDYSRDWSFAGDIANALFLINQSDDNKNYVIGSGKATSIKEIVEKISLLCKVNILERIIINPSLLREGDPEIIVSDPSLLVKALQWEPEYSVDDLLLRIYKKNFLI